MPSARDAIEALIFAYAERLDAGDFAGVGELFEHARYGSGGAATLTGAEVARLHEKIVIRYEDGTPRTKHVTTNLVVELDEDAGTATARSYYQVLQQVPGEGLGPIVAGRYADRFERVDGRWRFRERRIAVDLVGDLSRHLRQVPKGVG
jgi:3-phenylpropionate/cinnamic acid dioxygenase small subunit